MPLPIGVLRSGSVESNCGVTHPTLTFHHINISDIRSSTTLTLMIENEEIFEMLVFSSTLTQLIAQENFSAFIQHESFKSYKINSEQQDKEVYFNL
jgi:hypothetical protein